MHLNFYLFYWPLLKNIFSQQVLDSNLSDNDGGLVDNEDDQEKEDSPMIPPHNSKVKSQLKPGPEPVNINNINQNMNIIIFI